MYCYDSISFENGKIIEDTLEIENIEGKPNFKRVKFDAFVPYKVVFKDDEDNTIVESRTLPIYNVDIVVYMPDTRDEIKFRIVLDTFSKLLYVNREKDTISVGVFNKISVVLRVQLLIPAFGYYDVPPTCEDYNEYAMKNSQNTCDDINGYEKFYP